MVWNFSHNEAALFKEQSVTGHPGLFREAQTAGGLEISASYLVLGQSAFANQLICNQHF